MNHKKKTFNWKPLSEYNGGRVLATNGLDILIGEINSDGDCADGDGCLLCGITAFADIEDIMPKPKESEDDRIRKELLAFIKKRDRSGCDYDYDKWIAWLEKQAKIVEEYEDKLDRCVCESFNKGYKAANEHQKEKQGKQMSVPDWMPKFLNELRSKKNYFDWDERRDIESHILAIIEWMNPNYFNGKDGGQMPADSVEPKFHEGEWLIDKEDNTIFIITKVLEHTYKYATNTGKEYSCTHYSLEQDARPWTINDAKDGDVLATKYNDNIFLYNGKLDLRGRVCAYCGIYQTYDGIRFTKCAIGNYFTDKEPHPATKKQCNLLFQKMHDAGYTFDFEKKELKKIEDKPLVIDEGKDEIDRSFTKMMLKDKTRQTPAWGREDEQNLNAVLGYIDDEYLRRWLKDAIYNKYENPYEWSEEDEHKIKDIVYFLDTAKKHYASTVELDACIEWIKSLKNRVQLRQEWSEEEGKRLQRIIDFLWHNRKGDTDTIYQQEQDINWLKTLRLLNTRKPSDEQVKAFEHFVRSIGESGYASPYENITKLLYSLLNDLKKLQEE